jgi:Amt family ammonium transporter
MLLMATPVAAQEGSEEPVAEQVAEEAPAATSEIDSGDTAWMIVATALVLFMTLPGLALFYGGLVRSKNVLSVLVQCFFIAGVMSLIWVVFGYSLAYGTGNAVIGDFSKLFLAGVGQESVDGTIPESVFVMFQMTFIIITPALIIGAFAERMKFSAVMIFTTLWAIFSYLPVWHMTWQTETGLFDKWGVLDFAGGTVVHINAGIAGLIAAIMVGKREGYPQRPMKPHNLPLTVMGAAMLWVGWFGFNAGSALAANGQAGMAMLVTHLATATAVVVWSVIEWGKHGKPSALGAATGAVAGLVAITPASGTVGPMGAIVIGALSAVVCFIFATTIKRRMGYDDALDVFGVHGIGGIIGCVLTGVFASTAWGGFEEISIGSQVGVQTASAVVTLVWSGIVSVVILGILKATIGLRPEPIVEREGLDINEHGESGYNELATGAIVGAAGSTAPSRPASPAAASAAAGDRPGAHA